MDKELQLEEKRLQRILTFIDEKSNLLQQESHKLQQDTIQLRKEFRDDLKMNLDNIWDKLETFASIQQQNNLVSIKEQTKQHIEKQRKVLEKLRQAPYFARVDFTEEGTKRSLPIYIGIAALRENDDIESFLIYDWRAPISSIYYDYAPGPASYDVGGELIRGVMNLKRQFILENGHIKSMFDTTLTIGDDMLKEVLSSHANNQMKNIVSTIQKEQNLAIRNTKSSFLIIQGAAGSGKTSVALQRVAFLLYRNRDKLSSKNMLLFSPNPLFSSYVASVLPDLGEENIQQITFQDYVADRIGKQFTIETPFEQMEWMLTKKEDPTYQIREEAIHYKASLAFKSLIDATIERLSSDGMVFKTISFQGEKLISGEQIKKYFYSLDKSISIPNRMEMTRKWLLEELKKKEFLEREKEWFFDEMESFDSEEVFQSDYDFEQEQQRLIKNFLTNKFKPLRTAIKNYKFIHVLAIYRSMFNGEHATPLHDKLPERWTEICSFTCAYLNAKTLRYEDQAPFLYLLNRLSDVQTNKIIQHILVDEAQDYSPFQFHVIKQLFPTSQMTILGDFNQAIFTHSTKKAVLMTGELFDKNQVEKTVLTKSYRSTREIVLFTKELIETGASIEAFERSGKKPILAIVESEDELHEKVLSQLQRLKSIYKTIAVISKTMKEAEHIYYKLHPKLDMQLMTFESKGYLEGVIAIPSYLAKGLEFDAVIIYNASEKVYSQKSERNLFYTACTRAMHELNILSLGKKCRFLDHVPEHLFTQQ